MAFTTKEFPGRVFSSLEELISFKEERELLRKQFFLGTIKANRIQESHGNRDSSKTNDMEEE